MKTLFFLSLFVSTPLIAADTEKTVPLLELQKGRSHFEAHYSGNLKVSLKQLEIDFSRFSGKMKNDVSGLLATEKLIESKEKTGVPFTFKHSSPVYSVCFRNQQQFQCPEVKAHHAKETKDSYVRINLVVNSLKLATDWINGNQKFTEPYRLTENVDIGSDPESAIWEKPRNRFFPNKKTPFSIYSIRLAENWRNRKNRFMNEVFALSEISGHLGKSKIKVLERRHYTDKEKEAHLKRKDLLMNLEPGSSLKVHVQAKLPLKSSAESAFIDQPVHFVDGKAYQIGSNSEALNPDQEDWFIDLDSGEEISVKDVDLWGGPHCNYVPPKGGGNTAQIAKVSSYAAGTRIYLNIKPSFELDQSRLDCHLPPGHLPLTMEQLKKITGGKVEILEPQQASSSPIILNPGQEKTSSAR